MNGQVADLGTRVDPAHDRIELDGREVRLERRPVVIALNKPWGVVTTMADDQGRPCVGDIFKDYPQRLFHVGRLDEETEGLLLLTNDGDLAHQLTHPSHGVQKTYLATVRGRIPAAAVERLLRGVDLEDGPAKADRAEIRSAAGDRSVVEIVLHEGRKRIVRRMCKAVGHPVVHLLRTHIGSLDLDRLASGEWRELTASEIRLLAKEANH